MINFLPYSIPTEKMVLMWDIYERLGICMARLHLFGISRVKRYATIGSSSNNPDENIFLYISDIKIRKVRKFLLFYKLTPITNTYN